MADTTAVALPTVAASPINKNASHAMMAVLRKKAASIPVLPKPSGPAPPQQRPNRQALRGSPTYIRPEQRLVIGSAIPNVIPRALQHRGEGTLLIVCRHSRGIMISDQLSLGHPNERDRQGRMGDVLERYQFRAKLI